MPSLPDPRILSSPMPPQTARTPGTAMPYPQLFWYCITLQTAWSRGWDRPQGRRDIVRLCGPHEGLTGDSHCSTLGPISGRVEKRKEDTARRPRELISIGSFSLISDLQRWLSPSSLGLWCTIDLTDLTCDDEWLLKLWIACMPM